MRRWFALMAMPLHCVASAAEDIAGSAAAVAEAELETVTVLGQRDQSVVVVEMDEPEGSLAYGLLAELPGVHVQSSGGYGTLTTVRVRGGEADHLLVVRDGVKLNALAGPDWGVPFKGAATKAYFLPGAQGAMCGGGAASGVLRLETPRPEKSSLVVSPSVGKRYRHGKLAGSLATESGYLSLDWERDEDFGRGSAQRGDEDVDGFRYTDLRARAGTALRDWRFDLAIEGLTGRSDYDPGDSSTWHSRRIYRAEVAAHEDWTWRYSKVATRREHVNAWGESATEGERDHHSLAWQRTENLSVLIEREAEDYRQESSYIRGAIDTLTVYSVSVQHQRRSRFVDWAFALRKDWNSAFEDFVDYRWGLKTRRAGWAAQGFVGVGTGARRPTPLELAGWPGFVGNAALAPEENLSIETGVEGETWRVALFRERAVNAIDGWACTEPTAGLYCQAQRTAVNLPGAARRTGVELQLHRGGLKVAYTYVDARNEGQWELRRPRNLLAASYRRQIARGVSAQVALNCSSRFKDYGVASVPGHCLTHLDILWETSLGRVRVRADNALNKDYQPLYGYNGAGRSVVLRMEVPIL